MELLNAALKYADDGWEVFPLYGIDKGRCECGVKCSSPGKHPRVNWDEMATTDPDTITRWWKRWPNANIGVATGERSGIYVVDVDNKGSVDLGGGTLIGLGDHSLRVQQREAGYQLPETLTATTGSGGMHLIFSYPTGHGSIPNRGGLLSSVDTRGDGGYIVAAPSLHASGNRYRWVEQDQPLSVLPTKWVELIQSGKTTATPDGRVELELPEGFTVSAGEGAGRHDWLFRVGAKLRGQHGMPKLALYGALQAYNRAVCRPPLDAKDIEHIVDSCMKYEPEYNLGVDTDEDAVPELSEGDDLAVLLADFLASEPTPLVPLVSHLLHSGEAMILGGPPNVGKTWATMDMMLGIAGGGRFLEHFNCSQAPVLFVDEEGSLRGDWERFNLLLGGRGLDPSAAPLPLYAKIDSGIRLDTEKGHAQLARLIERYRPGAVFLDSLVRVHGGDEQSNRAMANLFAVVKRLMVTYGTSFVFTHHVRKQSAAVKDDPLYALRGAGDIQGFPDSICVFLPGEVSEEARVIHTKMRNGKRLQPFVMRMQIDEAAGEARLGYYEQDKTDHENRTRDRILALLRGAGLHGLLLTDVAAETGLSTKTTTDHLKVLAAVGKVDIFTQNGKTRYAWSGEEN